MPSSRLVSTTARTESLPRLCPSLRLRPRRWAQRPLPSMMMATWRGSRSLSMTMLTRFLLYTTARLTSHRHELIFFALEDFVELVDIFVGSFLYPVLRSTNLIFGNLLVFLHFFESFVRIPPMVAQRHPIVLGNLTDVAYQL